MNARRSISRWLSFVLILIVLFGAAAFPKSAHAAGIVVNSLADSTATDGHCTLREAVENAVVKSGDHPDCATGGAADIITFSVSGTITLVSPLSISGTPDALKIDGTGQAVVISGNHTMRVIEVGALPLTLNRLTIANGHTSDWGGGIDNNAGGTLTITNSTLKDNSSGYGGAIFNGATLIVANSTFVGNSAVSDGSAIHAKNATTTILNSTIAANTSAGSAIGVYGGTTTLRNTIVANNTAANCGGTITNGGNNIDTGATCGWGSANGSKSNTKPLLGPLSGSPKFFTLQAGSPALDAGNDAVCAAAPVSNQSQNGANRPQGTHCDIGSYEKVFLPITATVLSNATQDGWVLESSETSGIGGSINSTAATLRLGDDAARKQYRSILSFTTSSLPDAAVITHVDLKFRKQSITGGGEPVFLFQGFMVDIMKGTFNLPALQASDFQATGPSTVYRSLGPFLGPVPDIYGWVRMPLPAAACPYINTLAASSGLTQIRLRFKLDDNNNTIANYLSLYSGENLAADRPRLIIQYYVR